MAPAIERIWPMVKPISFMAVAESVVVLWISAICFEISSVAVAVCAASSLTSPATTANPLPASPARAASIVAFSASRLVCSAMDVMTLTTEAISCEEAPSLPTVSVVVAAMPTALPATWAAAFALCAISRIAACICSEPVATVPTLRDTSPAEDETTPACWATPSTFTAIAPAVLLRFADEPASRWAESRTMTMTSAKASRVTLSDRFISAISRALASSIAFWASAARPFMSRSTPANSASESSPDFSSPTASIVLWMAVANAATWVAASPESSLPTSSMRALSLSSVSACAFDSAASVSGGRLGIARRASWVSYSHHSTCRLRVPSSWTVPSSYTAWARSLIAFMRVSAKPATTTPKSETARNAPSRRIRSDGPGVDADMVGPPPVGPALGPTQVPHRRRRPPPEASGGVSPERVTHDLLGGTQDRARGDQLDGGLDLRREVPVGPGTLDAGRAEQRDDGARGRRRLERPPQVERPCGGEHLDRDDPGQAVDGAAQLAGRRPAHRDVVLLHGAGGDRVDGGRHREALELGDDRGLGVLGDHVAAVDAGVVGQERRQPVVAGLVEEAVGTPLADRRDVGGDDREEVEHVGDRRAVEVAVGLHPALVGE